jgi:conjugative transposon TraM protein
MKSINFKSPKYIIPLIALPFLFIFFWVYRDFAGKSESKENAERELIKGEDERVNHEMPDPSTKIQDEEIMDKFGAYADKYKRSKDASAVRKLGSKDDQFSTSLESQYTDAELLAIDSIQQLMAEAEKSNRPKTGYGGGSYAGAASDPEAGRKVTRKPRSSSGQTNKQGNRNLIPKRSDDQELERALAQLNKQSGSTGGGLTPSGSRAPRATDDPYERSLNMFKTQMNYMDSLEKARDPKYQASLAAKKAAAEAASNKTKQSDDEQIMSVEKASSINQRRFNTLTAAKSEKMIQAMVDQNMKGMQGSRIRFRLLDDIDVQGHTVRNGSYLFGRISGFSEQRVKVQITSILIGDKILPVDLSIYDNDGIEGFYVPASQFREFAKTLGANSSQSITLSTDPDGNRVIQSILQRMFRTTTTAAGSIIKANKASIKYNTVVYLVSKK